MSHPPERNYSLDLVEIIRIIGRRWKTILGFTVIAGIIALAYALIVNPLYDGFTSFIIKSPQVVDRNQLYRSEGAFDNKYMFATEDDIDQVIAIAKGDAIIKSIANQFDFAKEYKETDSNKVFQKVKKRFSIERNDTRQVGLRFKDGNPQLAADVANFAKDKIEEKYMGFFSETNQNIISSIRSDMKGLDSTLYAMKTGKDTNFISEEERNTIFQNLIKDKAHMLSLINQYSIGSSGTPIHMFYVLEGAGAAGNASFPNKLMIIGATLMGSFIFICILMVLQTTVSARKLMDGE